MNPLITCAIACAAALMLSACGGSASTHQSSQQFTQQPTAPATPEPTAGQPVPSGFPAADAYAAAIFDATNAARMDDNLPALRWSDCAADKATDRAASVLTSGVLEHPPLSAQCGDNNLAGENLVHSIMLPKEAVDAWMASPGHRANIVNEGFTEMGVACVASDLTDTTAAAAPDAAVGGMLCSEIFEGHFTD